MKHYCVISHTHWDREWYLPLENFRLRLVDLIDHLLEILQEDSRFRFHLDAQTIVLEDYLAVRPHRKEEMKKQIAAGRILVGPWYVQNDFHLTSGEATVRNLLLGKQQAQEFGGCMQVGYAADQFGVIAQFPQILNGFSLDSCVFGRGFDRKVTEFYWKTEDGSQVLCEHMKFWYNNLQRLPEDPEMALNFIRSRGEQLEPLAAGSQYLLMNGVDHLEAQENLTAILDSIQPLLKEDEKLFQDTLPEFIDRLKAEIVDNHLSLPVFQGEFRDNGADNVLTGTLAARVYLKQANAYCQVLLEKRLETLYVLLQRLKIASFPVDHLHYLWKLLIENHPHDSICGCSVDAVHRHMMDRFARITEMGEELVQRGLALLQEHLDLTGLENNQFFLTIFNPSPLAWKKPLEAVIRIPTAMDRGGVKITERNGNTVPVQLLSMRKKVSHRTLSPINLPGAIEVTEYRVMISAPVTAAFSYQNLIVTPCEEQNQKIEVLAQNPRVLENERLWAEIQENGTVRLKDKRSGRTFENLLLLEDNVDIGDSYNYIENDGSSIVTNEKEKVKITSVYNDEMIQRRRVEWVMNIDRRESRGAIPISMEVSLEKGSDALDVNIHVDNTIGYHRMRVLVPTGIQSKENYAGQPFDCYVRAQQSPFENDKTHPFEDYVGIEDQQGGMSVMARGLYEYEHMQDGTLAITLLRCVDRICGGWSEEVEADESWQAPEAQCLGEHTFSLSLYPYSGNRREAQADLLSQQFLSGAQAAFAPCDRTLFQGGRPFVQDSGTQGTFFREKAHPEIVLPHEGGLMEICGAFQVTACKAAEDGDGWILRGFNPGSNAGEVKISLKHQAKEVFRCNLAEENQQKLMLDDQNHFKFAIKPKEIVSVRIKE